MKKLREGDVVKLGCGVELTVHEINNSPSDHRYRPGVVAFHLPFSGTIIAAQGGHFIYVAQKATKSLRELARRIDATLPPKKRKAKK